MDYEDIKCLHKEILQWLVHAAIHFQPFDSLCRAICTMVDDDVVCCILMMNSVSIQNNVMHFLLGGTEGLNGHTLIHNATSASPRLLETILMYSGLPLNVIANVHEEYIYV